MSLDNLGSTAFARVRALKRIEAIKFAKDHTELVYRFGTTVGYLNAANELRALGDDDWSNLLSDAEHAHDNHPLVSVTSADYPH
ncbi:hypothetical protein NLO74_21390 [Pseudomonas tremae]|uniref:hypothetical protein n=1 Tax=Pseudomonas syringae group TaxID=136849 RepID=UPI0004654CEA|nr:MULTISPECIES: hypothetical protein [Pseudomonas syringae group]MCF5803362.1 hypothetical protein [Pseudomonas tremae]MCF5807154.1 hypothetical protein [Pseudomonas tremae]MCQ3028545.1 hypothetical protein [Pseudomonas tremae]